MNEMEERKFSRLLKVAFTSEERIAFSEEIANAIRNLKKTKDDKASVDSRFASEIKKYEGEIASLAEKVNSGWEMRSVPCREVRDFPMGIVVVFRDDTQEMIEERPMTAEERQPDLPFKETVIEEGGHPTPAEAQADSQSGAGERMAALEIPVKDEDLPEDTNQFYVGKKEEKNDRD